MIHIAIDGPSGAGKSTIARLVAARLGFMYIDTGALYRSVGVAALKRGFDPGDEKKVEQMLPIIRVTLGFVDGIQHVYVNDEDVSVQIRLPEASMAASAVSALPAVRRFLFGLQQDLAASHNCVMDGRDIGTVVLPDAEVKIFLTASPEVRAQRRYRELIEKGNEVNFDALLKEIIQRDYNDSHRAVAPLKKADDAVEIDSSEMTLDEVTEQILAIVHQKIGEKA